MSTLSLLRPVRDAMGIQGGVDALPGLFTATWLTMIGVMPLFGWASRRIPTGNLLHLIHGSLMVQLLVFGLAMHGFPAETGRVFFVWFSVINLLTISLFWSTMADRCAPDRARRYFSRIAAGGTLGTLTGPAVASVFAGSVDILIAIAIALWGLALVVSRLLPPVVSQRHAIDGNPFSAVVNVLRDPAMRAMALWIVVYTMVSTFLYLQQAVLVAATMNDRTDQIRYFASLDTAINLVAIVGQAWITPRLIRNQGFTRTFALIPFLVLCGMILPGVDDSLTWLFVLLVVHRGGSFAVARPCREMLFTSESREDRYRTKNFADTALYRSGDALGAWLSGFLPPGLLSWIAVGIAGLWLALAGYLGHRHQRRTSSL